MDDIVLTVKWKLEQEARRCRELWEDEDGIGTIELVLILVVLIALVSIFKTQITAIINSILTKVKNNADAI